MTSKAEKLRRKRAGRPRIDGPRHECGQLVKAERKAETEKQVLSVALDARARVHGATAASNDALSGYTLGRIFLDGNINEVQRKAGDQYAARMNEYYHLTGIPHPSGKAQDLSRVRGFDGDETASRAKKARAASDEMMALEARLNSMPDGRQIKTTVFNTCVLDLEAMRTMPSHQMDWLDKGLNALALYFGIQGLTR